MSCNCFLFCRWRQKSLLWKLTMVNKEESWNDQSNATRK